MGAEAGTLLREMGKRVGRSGEVRTVTGGPREGAINGLRRP